MIEEFFEAVTGGDCGEVSKLLEAKPFLINAKDSIGETPLHWAATYGHLAVIEFLVAKGANINARDDSGGTPLSWASQKGHSDAVSYLRQLGGS